MTSLLVKVMSLFFNELFEKLIVNNSRAFQFCCTNNFYESVIYIIVDGLYYTEYRNIFPLSYSSFYVIVIH